MDPFIVQLTRIIHEERLQKYANRPHKVKSGSAFKGQLLPRLQKMFAALTQTAPQKTRRPTLKETFRG